VSRLRHALSRFAFALTVSVAGTLWIGLGVPGLELLPGVAAPGSSSAAISLQSALLGIDDGAHDGASVRAALRALGVMEPLSPNVLRHTAQGRSLGASFELSPRAVALAHTARLAQTPQAAPQAAPTALPPEPAASQRNDTPTSAPISRPLAPATPSPVQAPVAPHARKRTPAPHPAPAPPPVAAQALQAISFETTPPTDALVGGTYAVRAAASSGLAVTLSSGSPSECTIAGSTVSFTAAGTCVVEADQAGNASFRAAPQAQQSFLIRDPSAAPIVPSVQSLVFASVPPATATLGGTYVVDAVASSGLPVTFSVDAASFGVCRIDGTTVSFFGRGTCTVVAEQDGNGFYRAAPTVMQVFDVHRKPQTITFATTPPASAAVGGAAYTIGATADSGLAAVFSADPGSAGVCAVSGTTVTPVGAGTCVVDADQFGDSTFQAAPQVQQSFAVGSATPSRSVQSIAFTSAAPAGAVVGGTYAVSASASSGLAVTVAADPFSAVVCTVSAGTVTFVGIGTCAIDANQSGDAGYLPAPQAQQSFAVGRAAQAISFTSAPPSAVVGDTATVSAQATSGLAISLSADASSAGVCTVAGSAVSFVSAGTCVVDADQAGDATYTAATQVQQSFAVVAPSKSVQSIAFTSSAPAAATVGGTYAVGAAASSGLAVTFTASGACTVAGTTATFVSAGTCTIDAGQAGNASYDAAPTATQSFAIGRRAQTISFTSTPPSSATVGGAYAVSAAASSGLAVAFSSASAGVCTVSGTTVSFAAAGTCTVDADQSGDASYAAAPLAQQSFFVAGAAKSVQTITFTTTAPSSAAIGDTYVAGATASSGLPVSLSVAGACTLSGSTVSFTASGTCEIDADQAGDASYQATAQAQQTVAVGLAAQTISFTSTPPSPANIGDTYTVSASASSALAVAFSTGSAGVCTVSGSTVSLVGAGTCVVDADQAGDTTHAAAPRAQQSFAVGGPPTQSIQSITFTSTAPAGAIVGGTYTAAATASSGLAVTFSGSGACMVSGSTVSFVATGTCTIDADQAGDGAYAAAAQVQQSFAVALRSQTIAFTATPPSAATAGGATYAVSASASSGLAVSFTSASPAVCTVSGTTVSFVGGGTCTVDADQAGDANYQAAPQAQQSFAVAPATPPKSVQSITFTSTPPSSPTAGGTYAVSATASSGLAVVFSASGACTVSGAAVSFVSAGTCMVAADQPGDASYDAAPQVAQSFAVGERSQTISFTSTPPAHAVVGGTTVVSASSSSGLAVAFSSASPSICTVSGSTVSFSAAGTCVVDADQAGDGAYAAAAQVQQSFTVSASAPPKSGQTITFTSTPPSNPSVGGAYTVGATASSGLAVTFSADPSSSGVCTVSASSVSFVGRGTCTIDADQAGNATYNAAPQVQQSFTVGATPQTITYISAAPTAASVGGSTYTVSATASSGLAVSFTIDASSAGACTISGSTVTMAHAGTCTIDADSAGNGTYAAAPQAQQTFTVGRGSQTITFTSTPPNPAGDNVPPYTVTATATSSLPVTFTIDASFSSGVCSISGSIVTFTGQGVCVVFANQAGDADWLAAPQAFQFFFVKHHV
jgi:hypothetical protein